jgi:NADPH:quinone reductase-like Zn-dependent oxidoreductase
LKAVLAKKSGPPEILQVVEIEKPSPKENEVLIKVHAGTVTIGDVILRKLHPLLFIPFRLFGMQRKEIPGVEVAGEIEAVGMKVTRFKKGDQVFGTTTGLSVGGNAEYVCVPEEWGNGVLAIKPANLSYDEAAAIPVGAMTAVDLFKRVNIQAGQKVLVYGASGSVGTYAIQLAKYYGTEVTGVCSTANLELVKSIGADKVFDYTKEDFTKSGEIYDVIFDAVGKITRSSSKAALKDTGTHLSVKSPTKERIEDLVFIKELVEAGKLKAVIDRKYPLDQIVEAHRYVETGRKKGNVVITVAE